MRDEKPGLRGGHRDISGDAIGVNGHIGDSGSASIRKGWAGGWGG